MWTNATKLVLSQALKCYKNRGDEGCCMRSDGLDFAPRRLSSTKLAERDRIPFWCDVFGRQVSEHIVVGFEHETDARRFWEAMRKRLEEFSLSLHPDKTRLIEFGRHAAARRAQRELGKPETFKFLAYKPHTSPIQAVCLNRARTDLAGGMG